MTREIPERKTQSQSSTGTAAAPATEAADQIRTATDKAIHQAIIQIVYGPGGKVVETPVTGLAGHSPDFRKAILIIEDSSSDADRCRTVLQELGYDGIQLITKLHQAVDYLDDVLNNLTRPPDAIVLDLGLGYESGFDILRKCHANPKLQRVPILVWSRCAEAPTKTLSNFLGAKDFLVKSPDKETLKITLQRLLAPDGSASR